MNDWTDKLLDERTEELIYEIMGPNLNYNYLFGAGRMLQK